MEIQILYRSIVIPFFFLLDILYCSITKISFSYDYAFPFHVHSKYVWRELLIKKQTNMQRALETALKGCNLQSLQFKIDKKHHRDSR